MPPSATRHTWAGLGVLLLPTLIVSMDLSVLILALPSMWEALQPNATQALWITDVYGFVIAGALVTMGTLGDRIGRRRLLIVGAAAFGLASVAAAFAPTASLLILARAVQGLAGATLMPSTLSLIRALFERRDQRSVAISLWVATFSAGVVVGPVVAGILLEHFWWGSVLVINLPLMALLVAAAPFLLPESKEQSPGRFDLIGATLATSALLTAVFGIKVLARDGVVGTALIALAAAAILGAFFVMRQRTSAHPLLDLGLFRAPAFSTPFGINLLVGSIMAGVYLLTAQYLQLVGGLTALAAALWLLPQTVAMIVSSLVTARLARRVRPVVLMLAGMSVAAGGLIVLLRTGPEDVVAPIVTGFTLISLGFAALGTLAPDLILAAAPPEKAGAAAGVSETGNELGNALGIAVLGSIGVAAYRGELDRAVAGISPAEYAVAADSLDGALRVAAELEEPAASLLTDAAIAAFTGALHSATWLSLGLVVAGAVLVGVVLRRVSAFGVEERTDPAPTAGADTATP